METLSQNSKVQFALLQQGVPFFLHWIYAQKIAPIDRDNTFPFITTTIIISEGGMLIVLHDLLIILMSYSCED